MNDKTKKVFEKIHNTPAYISSFGEVIQREYGVNPASGTLLFGKWVLRDNGGNFIDYDSYRNDLSSRNGIELVENIK